MILKNNSEINLLKQFLKILLIVLCTVGCSDTYTLAHKTILVTAPEIYNGRLTSLIDAVNGDAIAFPIIETTIIENNSNLDHVLDSLDSYCAIVLPSRNAIKAFINRAGELGISTSDLNKGKYYAIGKDEDMLRDHNITSVVEILAPSPDGIFQSIKTKAYRDGRVAVLVPRVEGMPEPNVIPDFLDSLNTLSIQVERIEAYITAASKPQNYAEVYAKMSNNEIDLIVFTSTGEIQAMQAFFNKEVLDNCTIACFGPYTYNNAQVLGLEPAFMAKDYSKFEGFVEAMIEYYHSL